MFAIVIVAVVGIFGLLFLPKTLSKKVTGVGNQANFPSKRRHDRLFNPGLPNLKAIVNAINQGPPKPFIEPQSQFNQPRTQRGNQNNLLAAIQSRDNLSKLRVIN